tara:strand:+ start:658 stop:1167 length:510 start_codon:yes stop_codon:yes gene_type:complete
MEQGEAPFGDGYEQSLQSKKYFNKGNRAYSKAIELIKDGKTGAAERELRNAEKELRKSAKADQKNLAAFSLLGKVYARLGESRKSVGAFNYALQLNPKHYDSWLERAKVLLEMGLRSEVKQSFNVLERSAPNMAESLLKAIITFKEQRTAIMSTEEVAFFEWAQEKIEL